MQNCNCCSSMLFMPKCEGIQFSHSNFNIIIQRYDLSGWNSNLHNQYENPCILANNDSKPLTAYVKVSQKLGDATCNEV